MIKELFNLAGEWKPQLIQGTILYIISSLFAAAPYAFLYLILDALFKQSLENQKVVIWIGLIILCLIIQGLSLYTANRITYLTSYRMMGDLRLRLGDHIRKLPMGFFSQTQVGDLNSLVSDDMRKIEPIPSWVYPKIVSAIALPILIAAFLFFVDWRMTLATLTGVPVALAIYFGTQRIQKQVAQMQKQAIVSTNSRMIEYIQGLAVIKAFNQTGKRFNKLEKALNEYKQANLAMVTQLTMPVLAFAGVLDLGAAVILFVGAYLLFGGQMTVPTFLLFLVLSLRLYAPMHQLVEYSAMMRMMDAALDRITDVLRIQPLPEHAEYKELKKFDIEFRNVCFSYENTPILQNISFQVPQGSTTALVGVSGSGKTTITNLIARFWDVNAGEILVGEVNIKDLQIDDLLSHISIVFQDVYLFNDTILNNIKFGKKDATREEAIASAKTSQCHEFIQQLPNGYDTIIGESGATLSGGEKQRISIARAILKDAPIILLDEATASVDPENEIAIQKAINSLVQSKTLIIIAHRLSTITSADQILVINQGQIVERGKHEHLLSVNGVYQRLWESRQQAKSWKVMSKLS
ncbi:ABC transporter ATP-binding protein [Halotia wernerae UHCC 0503]|nr:ABC transporter ATP-binding protein [Halotia wernerae UHCC 0503]